MTNEEGVGPGRRSPGPTATPPAGTRARPWAGAIVGSLALLGSVGGGLAQAVDCARLQADIRASESDSGQEDNSGFSRAADQQRREIERTRRYAAQLRCGQPAAGFFEGGAPPECADIEDRLARMQDNLDRLQDRANQNGNDGRAAHQAVLIARFNASCIGNPGMLQQSRGGGDYLPDDGRNPADLTTVPMNPDDITTVPLNGDIFDNGSPASRNLGQAICVRSCDGGYFPLAARVSSDQVDRLDDLCKASCPNTEAHLYTMRGGEGLAQATSATGTAYSALPAAFKFEKTFSPTCSCKPPNQSWAQALDGAEKMLSSADKRDVTVTAAMSAEMAKPVAMPAPGATPTTPKGRKAGRDKAAAAQAAQAALPPAPDKRIVAEAERAAQAPTASNESAGIGGPAQGERVLGRSDGLRLTVPGPDGATKRIRLIVP